MRPSETTADRDVKASIAVGIADLFEPAERVQAVIGIFDVDEIEARLLISHGRRLRREKGRAA
jgi:hypothetical protein